MFFFAISTNCYIRLLYPRHNTKDASTWKEAHKKSWRGASVQRAQTLFISTYKNFNLISNKHKKANKIWSTKKTLHATSLISHKFYIFLSKKNLIFYKDITEKLSHEGVKFQKVADCIQTVDYSNTKTQKLRQKFYFWQMTLAIYSWRKKYSFFVCDYQNYSYKRVCDSYSQTYHFVEWVIEAID